jgi:hypothetical protein
MKRLLIIVLSICFMSCEKESLDPIEELYTQIPEGYYKYKLNTENWSSNWRERVGSNSRYSQKISWLEINNVHIAEYFSFRDPRFANNRIERKAGMSYSYKLDYPYITLNGANLQPDDDRQRDIFNYEEFDIEIINNGRIIKILRGSNIIMELHKIDTKP